MNRTRSAVSDWVVGLDLSLTGAGVCCIPREWDYDFSRVISYEFGYGAPRNTVERRSFNVIGEERWQFERLVNATSGVLRILPDGVLRVYAESVFLSRNPKTTMQLSKLRGSVEGRIWHQFGRFTWDVAPLSHHKLLTGSGSGARKVYGPLKNVKVQRRQALLAAGAPSYWTENQVDACSVANYGMCREFGRGFLGVTR